MKKASIVKIREISDIGYTFKFSCICTDEKRCTWKFAFLIHEGEIF